MRVVSWSEFKKVAIGDSRYSRLLSILGSDMEVWDDDLTEYERFRDELTIVDGVVVFRGRIVVPAALRKDVLRALHCAHQGSTSMTLRAADTVWWPGVAKDIARVREGCSKCSENTPSQSAAPPKPIPLPDYHFQMVSSDYFSYSGHKYLVAVDRYSGWPLVVRARDETAEELVRVLRGQSLRRWQLVIVSPGLIGLLPAL